MQGVLIRSLLRELRFHLTHGPKKKKKFCFKILYDLRKVEKQEEGGNEGLERQRV